MNASIPNRPVARDGTRFNAFREMLHPPRLHQIKDHTIFHVAVGQVARYEQFLRMIVNRYKDLSAKTKALNESVRPPA